jgi:hypothetical protein
MKSNTTPVEINGAVESHPSYGMIGISRVTGQASGLFGSDITHNNFVMIRIYGHGERERVPGHDFYRAGSGALVASIAMTEMQFAHMITSLNSGDTPCTLRHANGVAIPYAESTDTKMIVDHAKADLEKQLESVLTSISKAVASLDAMAEGSAPASKTRLKELSREIRIVTQNLPSNLDYLQQEVGTAMDKIHTEALASTEAHINSTIRDIGLQALQHSLSGPDSDAPPTPAGGQGGLLERLVRR